METVAVGDLVHWYPDGDVHQAPHAAVVTKVGHKTACLNIFSPSNYNLMIRDGVRHVGDPDSKVPELREQGAWAHTPQTLKIRELEEILLAGVFNTEPTSPEKPKEKK